MASLALTLAVFNNLIWILDTGLTLNHFLQHKRLYPDDIISFLFIGTYCLFFWSFYLRSIHPFLTTSFQVFSDKMFIYQGPTKKELLFSDIVEIEIHSRNGKKSWFILKSEKYNNIRISMALVRSHYILDTILKYNPQLVPKKAISFDDILFSLWKNIDLTGELKEARRHFIFSVIYWILIPTSFLFLLYYKQSPSFNQTTNHLYYLAQTIILIILASCLPYLLIRLSKKIVKQQGHVSSRLNPLAMGILTLSLISCLGMLYQSDLNLYRRIKVSKIMNAPKQMPFSWAIYDPRYHCTECTHPLNIGDTILYEGHYIGTVMALPGDIFPKFSIRGTASQEDGQSTTSIPKGSIGLESPEKNEIKIVPTTLIDGKIINY